MISGFPTETEEDHQETLSLMNKGTTSGICSSTANDHTYAARKMEDDIPLDVKAQIERNYQTTDLAQLDASPGDDW